MTDLPEWEFVSLDIVGYQPNYPVLTLTSTGGELIQVTISFKDLKHLALASTKGLIQMIEERVEIK